MALETHLDAARERVEQEQKHIAGERRAYVEFRNEVAAVRATTPRQAGSRAGGVLSVADAGEPGGAGQRQLREAFAETIQPYSVDDIEAEESVLETVREELGEGIALALAPSTDHGVTPQVKQAITTRTTERLADLEAMAAALDREAPSLATAADEVETVTDWLVAADETPLSALGFDELRERHETLERHRERCRGLLTDRQAYLHSTPGSNGQITMHQRQVVRFLYRSFPVQYPVLSTATRLAALLEDCQRAVRDHLSRRA